MPLPREAQSLNAIRDAYLNAGEVEYVKALYELRREQKEMIKRLADINGTTQVAIVRDIIDEWRRMKLGENGQQ